MTLRVKHLVHGDTAVELTIQRSKKITETILFGPMTRYAVHYRYPMGGTVNYKYPIVPTVDYKYSTKPIVYVFNAVLQKNGEASGPGSIHLKGEKEDRGVNLALELKFEKTKFVISKDWKFKSKPNEEEPLNQYSLCCCNDYAFQVFGQKPSNNEIVPKIMCFDRKKENQFEINVTNCPQGLEPLHLSATCLVQEDKAYLLYLFGKVQPGSEEERDIVEVLKSEDTQMKDWTWKRIDKFKNNGNGILFSKGISYFMKERNLILLMGANKDNEFSVMEFDLEEHKFTSYKVDMPRGNYKRLFMQIMAQFTNSNFSFNKKTNMIKWIVSDGKNNITFLFNCHTHELILDDFSFIDNLFPDPSEKIALLQLVTRGSFSFNNRSIRERLDKIGILSPNQLTGMIENITVIKQIFCNYKRIAKIVAHLNQSLCRLFSGDPKLDSNLRNFIDFIITSNEMSLSSFHGEPILTTSLLNDNEIMMIKNSTKLLNFKKSLESNSQQASTAEDSLQSARNKYVYTHVLAMLEVSFRDKKKESFWTVSDVALNKRCSEASSLLSVAKEETRLIDLTNRKIRCLDSLLKYCKEPWEITLFNSKKELESAEEKFKNLKEIAQKSQKKLESLGKSQLKFEELERNVEESDIFFNDMGSAERYSLN